MTVLNSIHTLSPNFPNRKEKEGGEGGEREGVEVGVGG